MKPDKTDSIIATHHNANAHGVRPVSAEEVRRTALVPKL